MPEACTASTAALIGSVLKYAAGPLSMIGWSVGANPALSGMRASSTLIATRSGVMLSLPAARPTATTVSGLCSSINWSMRTAAAPNSTGSTAICS